MASVNGKQVFQLSGALYFPTTNVVVESGGLYVSNVDGRTKLALKLRNLGVNTIHAMQLSVCCMDAFGSDLGEFQHQYIDLEAGNGKAFGEGVDANVPESNTRGISLKITAIIYADGQSWRQEQGETPIALPKAQPLPYSPDALTEFRAHIGCAQAADAPVTADGMWRCTCGAWNLSYAGRCCECNTEYSALKYLPSEEELKQAYASRQMAARRAEENARLQAEKERKAAEEKARQEREDAERAAKEEAKKLKKKRRRKVRRTLLLLFLILLVAAFPVIRFVGTEFLMRADKPELAFKLATFLPEYDYMPDETRYLASEVFECLGDRAMEAGNLEEARNYYEMIDPFDGKYSARQKRIAADHYFQGMEAEKSGDVKTARACYDKSGEFFDAKVRVADMYAAAGDYRSAMVTLKDKTAYAAGYAALREKYPQLDFVHRLNSGEPVTFGAYNNNGHYEAISWVRVPGNNNGYLVTEKSLFVREWSTNSKGSTWANSSLRAYLNDTFLYEAFSEAERELIIRKSYPMTISTSRVTWEWPVETACNDFVTLLSVAEAVDYFVANTSSTNDILVTSNSAAQRFWSRNATNVTANAGLLPITRNSSTNFSYSYTKMSDYRDVRPAITVDVNKLADLYVQSLPCEQLVRDGKYAEALELAQSLGSLGWKTGLYSYAMLTLEEVRSRTDADLQTRIDLYEQVVDALDQLPGYLNTEAEYQRAAYEIGLLYAEDNQIENALKALEFAGDYKDAKQQLVKVILFKADVLSAMGEYQQSNELLATVPAEDADDRVVQNLCSQAEALIAKEQREEVLKVLGQAETYPAAKAQITQMLLTKADALFEAGSYAAAREWLKLLPAEQVQDQMNVNTCAEAEVLLGQSKYLEARRLLTEIAGYARADELLAQTPAFAVLDEISAMESLTIGTFEQDGIAENGTEPVEWIVISKNLETSGHLDLLSRYVLASRAWDEEDNASYWGDNSLYDWLNVEFKYKAFNTCEDALLLNRSVSSMGKKDTRQTEGYVRLLTLNEAANCFVTVEESEAEFTAAAEKTFDFSLSKHYWWLCDIQNSGAIAMPFNTRQGISYNYQMVTSYAVFGIRPVITVDVNALVDVLLAEKEAAAQMEAADYQAVSVRTDITSVMQYQQRYARAMVLKQQIVTADANALVHLYKEYTTVLKQCGSYADAAQLYPEGCYQYANVLAAAGDYHSASDQYALAGEYKDAVRLRESSRVQQAVQAIEARSYTEAYMLLKELTDNEEAIRLLREDSHMVAYAKHVDAIQVGGTYTFGRYEQDSSKSNGTEPILWRILDKTDDGRVLLLADQILTHRAFHTKNNATWNDSSIRTWLNDTFANEAFTQNERGALALTSLDNSMSNNRSWGTKVDSVEDYVFLLSLGEALTYLDSVDACETTATSSAKDLYPYTSKTYLNYWFTRSTNASENDVALLPYTSISADKNPTFKIATPKDSYGIRPAVWLSIGQLVSMETALADGLALQAAGAYEAALDLLALCDSAQSTAATMETCFLLGEDAMKAGNYVKACEWYERAAVYPGAEDRLKEARYTMAAGQEAEGKYDEAVANYTLASDWQDAAACIDRCHYKHGMELLENKAFDAACEELTLAGNTGDAPVMILRSYYEKAEQLEARGDHAGALQNFLLATGWQDAQARQQESRYLLANMLITDRCYVAAQAHLAQLKGYKDADALAEQYRDAAHEEQIRTEWSVGSIVSFGATEQDEDLQNGAEEIQWRVLHVEGDRVLILSNNILTYRAFDEHANIWGTSSLRAWLNDDFYAAAFTDEEKACLRRTTQYNGKNSKVNAKLGDEVDTEDLVFLLSLSEAAQYLTSVADSSASPTEYAWSQNQHSKRGEYKNCWWTRVTYTSGSDGYAVYLPFTKYESANDFSFSALDYTFNAMGVRPAAWVDVTKIIDMTR